MTKSELVADIAARSGLSAKDAEAAIGAFFEIVTSEAKTGGKIAWPGFGTFQGKHRAARTGRNPQTGAPVQIPASTVLHFGAAAALKAALN